MIIHIKGHSSNLVFIRKINKHYFEISEARNDLTICRMTECNASVAGGKEILLFCEKVTKDDIEVRFYQEDNNAKVCNSQIQLQ